MISRVKPSGWGVNEKLTSSQMNTLDIDHTNVLDKTSAGDTIAGTVNFSGAGKITANLAASVKSTTAGGIQLAGGASDWVSFSATRSRTVVVGCHLVAGSAAATTIGGLPSSFSITDANAPVIRIGGFVTTAVNTPDLKQIPYYIPIASPHHGATLSSAVLSFRTVNHTAVPDRFPGFEIYTSPKDFSVTNSMRAAGPATFPATGSTSVYNPNPKTVTYTTDQNNVIDTSANIYFIVIWDEGGTSMGPGALVGNTYCSVAITYSNIADMRFA